LDTYWATGCGRDECRLSAATSGNYALADEVGLLGSRQNLVIGSIFLLRTSLPLQYKWHYSVSNITWHPELQHFLVEMRNKCAIPGMMCASVMLFGSHGKLRLHVCVNFNFVSFGRVTGIGWRAIFWFTIGKPSITSVGTSV